MKQIHSLGSLSETRQIVRAAPKLSYSGCWVQSRSPLPRSTRGSETHVKVLVGWLTRYKRPTLCTEYMSRGNNSTFQNTLPVAKKYKVAAINRAWLPENRKRFCRRIRGKIPT